MKKAIIEGNYSYTHNFGVTVHTDILIQYHLPFWYLSVLSHSFGFLRYLVTLEHKALWKNITGLEKKMEKFCTFQETFCAILETFSILHLVTFFEYFWIFCAFHGTFCILRKTFYVFQQIFCEFQE